MVRTEQNLVTGDLVTYTGNGTDEYKNERSFGVVVGTLGNHMVKVKWSKMGTDDCWYQKRALKKLNNQKSLNFYLTYVW